MSLRRSTRHVDSFPAYVSPRKARLGFSTIKFFHDGETDDEPELAHNVTASVSLPESTAQFNDLICSDTDQNNHRLDQVLNQSDSGDDVPTSLDSMRIDDARLSDSNRSNDTGTSKSFDDSGHRNLQKAALPTPQPTPHTQSPPFQESELALTRDLEYHVAPERMQFSYELTKADKDKKEETLIGDPVNLPETFRAGGQIQLEHGISSATLTCPGLVITVDKVVAEAKITGRSSLAELEMKGEPVPNQTDHEGTIKPSVVSQQPDVDLRTHIVHDNTNEGSEHCHSDRPDASLTWKRKQKRHKRKHRNEIPDPPVALPPESSSCNTNSFAEYKRQMLGKHQHKDHLLGHKSTFVTIRRNWYR